MTRQRALERSRKAAEACPLLREALLHVAHAIIRNRGTVGGSIAHADPAAELPSVLVALGGKVRATGPNGTREIPAEELFEFHFTTTLAPDEDPDRGVVPGSACGQRSRISQAARRLRPGRGRLRPQRRQRALSFTGVGPRPLLVEGDDPDAAASAAEPAADIHHGRVPPRARPCAGGPRGCDRAPTRVGRGAVSSTVRLRVNGRDYERRVEPRLLLSDFIRHELGLKGTHVGCEHGVCGCCTIRLDGAAVRSCLLLAGQANGSELLTIEGIAAEWAPTTAHPSDQPTASLHPIQAAFRDCHGLQCGFCTPGFVLAIHAFLEENPRADLTEEEIREGISGNLCRCTGYQNIVDAVKLAARTMYGGA
jgi:aerobic carbon-monoxide dehydrogenase small subunit